MASSKGQESDEIRAFYGFYGHVLVFSLTGYLVKEVILWRLLSWRVPPATNDSHFRIIIFFKSE